MENHLIYCFPSTNIVKARVTEQMELSCHGNIVILQMSYLRIKSVVATIRDTQSYCKKHLHIKGTKQSCFISLQKIYNVEPGVYQDGITEIYYMCL